MRRPFGYRSGAAAAALAAAAVAMTLAGCGHRAAAAVAPSVAPPPSSTSTSTSTSTTSTTAPKAPSSVVAQVVGTAVNIYGHPGDANPVRSLPSIRPLGGPQVLLVLDRTDAWLHVALPVRPNGSTGWVRSQDVSTSAHDFRIRVELSAHRITFYQGFVVLDSEPIAVGTQATPTPGGLYYTVDFVKTVDPGGPYGPYAYGLSGFSDVLTSFAGGPGQLAIHGTNEPWLLGHSASHGCIRMSNAGITKVAQVLPLGVPVRVDA